MKIPSRQLRRYLLWGILGFLLAMLTVTPVRLAIALYQMPEPQAFVTLDGGKEAIAFTAQFAEYFPSLDIWVSTSLPTESTATRFATAGINRDRLHFVQRSSDTVANFTTLLDDFQSRQIQHVYLIAPDFYMLRATAIAYLIWGSEGLAYTPVEMPTPLPPESPLQTLQDVGRSLTWLFLGRTMR